MCWGELVCVADIVSCVAAGPQLPAVTAAYAGTDQLPAAVEAAVRAQQNNATSVSLALAAARILEKVWRTPQHTPLCRNMSRQNTGSILCKLCLPAIGP